MNKADKKNAPEADLWLQSTVCNGSHLAVLTNCERCDDDDGRSVFHSQAWREMYVHKL